MTKQESIKELSTIPSVGKKIAEKLYNVGIHKVADLKNRDPEDIYARCCIYDDESHCRCLLYTFRCAVYYASTENPNPELLLKLQQLMSHFC